MMAASVVRRNLAVRSQLGGAAPGTCCVTLGSWTTLCSLHRFIAMRFKAVTFIDSTFLNCYFEDVSSVGSSFKNCTFIDSFFYNTG